MDEKPELFISSLVSDAKQVASYGQRTNKFDSGNLASAINVVENTAPEKVTADQMSALQKELFAVSGTLPRRMISSLRYGGPGKKPTKTIISMIMASIALMIVAANLTLLYNRGSALASDLRALQASEPERHFGQLARQLFIAMREIADGSATGEGVKSDVLEQQAYFQIYDDLHEIDQKFLTIQNGILQYQIDNVYPIWGMANIKYYYYVTLKNTGMGDREVYAFIDSRQKEIQSYQDAKKKLDEAQTQALIRAQGQSQTQSEIEGLSQGPAKPSGSMPTIATVVGSLSGPPAASTVAESKDDEAANSSEYVGKYICGQASTSEAELDRKIKMLQDQMNLAKFADLTKNYYYSLLYLSCYEHFAFLPYSTPSLDEMKTRLAGIMTPYAFWILPGIYGALGALIFHLRLLLDPRLPNPEWFRIVHRVALGSLAGMILAWFWLPDTTIGSELANVGFGLFSLAFVFGFSLDVFFAMLDRFVSLSVSAMGKVGADQAKPGPQPAPSA
jgi:hypothetical protein